MLWFVAACAVLAAGAPVLSQPIRFSLAPVFTDNMVLQQNREVPVWGKGKPGTRVVLRTTWGEEASAGVSTKGLWSLKIPTPKAGGPYELSFSCGESTRLLRNVLVGEVWVCSGQSNMEMPLAGWPPQSPVANSAVEIDAAHYPLIRLFTVQRAHSSAPSDRCEGSWLECSPQNAGGFSATAYFFGRALYEALNMPIGLINTSYSGTPIEAWMSRKALSGFREYADLLKKPGKSAEGKPALDQWVERHQKVAVPERNGVREWCGLRLEDDRCSAPDFDDAGWDEMTLPKPWEQSSIGDFDGVVWLRRSVAIPQAWVGTSLVLRLGPIDDMDETYVNGRLIGSRCAEGFEAVDRVYAVPDSVVRDSILHIAIRVIDVGGSGGIYGDERKMRVYQEYGAQRVFLAGDWKYMPIAEFQAGTLYMYGAETSEFENRPKPPAPFSPSSPTALYNGMVNPIVPFAIRGVIWYQGEENRDRPEPYRRLFPAMIDDWREAFHCGEFPFYYVQLAPYDYGSTTRSQLLREAQLQALSTKNTGMAVTLDIGDPKNIHPANKQDVGKRLALWALAKTYGKPESFSGPLYYRKVQKEGRIVLLFRHAEKGLILRESREGNGFQIAGGDKKFRDAIVTIEGSSVIVSHPDVPQPQAVRYAFTNTAEATLFNAEGLPAPSFRTDTWNQ
jgi:sialate O-acetylesterase